MAGSNTECPGRRRKGVGYHYVRKKPVSMQRLGSAYGLGRASESSKSQWSNFKPVSSCLKAQYKY
jgi:hypothetical protein